MSNLHTLSPYTIRCFDSQMDGGLDKKYAALGKVRGSHDVFDIFKEFVERQGDGVHTIEEKQQVYRLSDFLFDEENRVAYGWFQFGRYGAISDIINVETGVVDYSKTLQNAEILSHFVYFYIPRDFNEGIALLHSHGKNGIKTVFYELFKKYFSTQVDCAIHLNPLHHDEALSKWADATVKSIKLTKFKKLNDLADTFEKMGHDEIEGELTLRPKKGFFGSVKDFMTKGSKYANFIEAVDPMCATVKTTVTLNGRSRTLSINSNLATPVVEIEYEGDLHEQDSWPEYDKMASWCKEVVSDLASDLHYT